MARNKTLSALLTSYRGEARLSLNAAHNNQVRDTQIAHLARVQEWLYEDFAWPHRRIERQYPAAAGQRLYDFSADFDMERIEKIQFKSDGAWLPVKSGIGPEHYAASDSDLDEREAVIRRYALAENDQVEVWPISSVNGTAATREAYIKVIGIAKLPALVADGDRAVLDDRLIILFAAAETLGASGAKDANIKLNLANKRFASLKSALMKSRTIKMFGVGQSEAPRRPMITRYRQAGS